MSPEQREQDLKHAYTRGQLEAFRDFCRYCVWGLILGIVISGVMISITIFTRW